MKFYSRQRRMPQVIIVSLIDVFVILLIFVIMTTTFKKDNPAFNIQLPDAKTAVVSDKAEESVVLSITPDESLYLDDRKVTPEELKTEIERMVKGNDRRHLALRCDKKAPYGIVIKVLDILREAGVKGEINAFTEELKS